jgi:hypothetical protein
MSTLLSKLLISLSFALGAAALCAAPLAQAEPASKTPKAAKSSKAKSKGKSKKAEPKEAAAPDPEADEPDTTDHATTDFDCELGNKVTIYNNAADEEHIALRWKKRLHRLTRVGTTTGAQRYENKKYGLLWIGIPAKGMLLDSKANRQLANECKNAEQMNHVHVETPAIIKN